jgi:putative proteasome-type protease
MRLFLVYSAGNFIEATRETCFFQIGESKYGKPILDRVLTPHAAGRGRQVRAGVDGLDAQVQPLGGPAAGPAGLRGRQLRSDRIAVLDEHNPTSR